MLSSAAATAGQAPQQPSSLLTSKTTVRRRETNVVVVLELPPSTAAAGTTALSTSASDVDAFRGHCHLYNNGITTPTTPTTAAMTAATVPIHHHQYHDDHDSIISTKSTTADTMSSSSSSLSFSDDLESGESPPSSSSSSSSASTATTATATATMAVLCDTTSNSTPVENHNNSDQVSVATSNGKSKARNLVGSNNNNINIFNSSHRSRRREVMQLAFGATGIYVAYLWYGHIQEDLFHDYAFSYAWFLQLLESLANVAVGYAGRHWCTRISNSNINNNNNTCSLINATTIATAQQQQQQQSRPSNNLTNVINKRVVMSLFWQSGASQVFAKALTSLALASGLSFPVCTLAKSAKIVPVMFGQLILGGSTYRLREYAFAALLVLGTALLSGASRAKSKADTSSSSTAGILFILLSLCMDGITGGLQKRLKRETASQPPTTYDFLYHTNVAMAAISLLVCLVTGELYAGWNFVHENVTVQIMLIKVCFCSAVGQSFVFYVVATFDAVVCSTITTTRKIGSVMWSIAVKGHFVGIQGMMGLGLAMMGLFLQMYDKHHHHQQQQQQRRHHHHHHHQGNHQYKGKL